eukprot:CAMPEP_0172303502 /NCGR_PEP_ID=MMETSP1058-20130122/5034_1 /TAXON_ID=83371 /ORGANISM="Detonula confervacea, Strain CCMP 353" /LENGTH=400 /DNA_ID=CAMNT_0013014343 /DNA_START=117 /DNA_END=1319 /DNA_ORIENTATION=-
MSGHHIENTTAVAVGTPPAGYEYSHEQMRSVEVHFHNFTHLPSESYDQVFSPEFTCLGRQWKLELNPGGRSNPTKIAILLHLCSSESIELEEFSFSVKKYGKLIAHWSGNYEFEGEEADGSMEFAKRSKLIDARVEGTLIIEVQMKLLKGTGTRAPPLFIPENPLVKSILKKFMDEESADVVFEVGSDSKQGAGGARKRAKTVPSTFYAHHLILQDCAPDLAELCKLVKKPSSVPIADVNPDIFRHMLYYIYGGKVSDEELKANAKDIIDAADKYGVVNLKLEAEACYAKSITLTVDNMLDNLLYADAKNCALLKEVVMDFIVENGRDILGKVSFEDVPGSMMTDLLTAMTRKTKKDDDSSDGCDYDTMRVSALRKKLDEKGLNIDGSRETMIALLKENS